MADVVFNIARGKTGYYATLPAANDAFIVVLLKSSGLVADATMVDYDTLAAVLAGASDECDFTNYARKSVTSLTPTVDDTNDRLDIDMADQTWTSAGGASNNTVGAMLICYDGDTTGGADTDIVPLVKLDFSATTDGSDLVAQFATSGFYRSS